MDPQNAKESSVHTSTDSEAKKWIAAYGEGDATSPPAQISRIGSVPTAAVSEFVMQTASAKDRFHLDARQVRKPRKLALSVGEHTR